jgi:hypothetical protein
VGVQAAPAIQVVFVDQAGSSEMNIKQRPIDTFTYWSAILTILSGCTGGIGCFGFTQKQFKEICEKRTIELRPDTESAFQVILKNCLNSIPSEGARAIKAKAKYESIINKANQDNILRKEYESEKSNWEKDEAQQAKEWQLSPIYSGSIENKRNSGYNLTGVPTRDSVKSAIYSSYVAWLEKKKLRQEVEASGWNSIASDMKVFANQAKCKE